MSLLNLDKKLLTVTLTPAFTYDFVYLFLLLRHLGCLVVLGLHKEEIWQMFKCVSFWLHSFCG